MPPAIAPYLAGAALHALPKNKKTGIVRPMLRRLAGKVLCQAVREDCSRHFWPAQVGVGARMGGEAAVRATRQWTARNSEARDKVLLKVDFKNAFSTGDRLALYETRIAFPAGWIGAIAGPFDPPFWTARHPFLARGATGRPAWPFAFFQWRFNLPCARQPSAQLNFVFRTWMTSSLPVEPTLWGMR